MMTADRVSPALPLSHTTIEQIEELARALGVPDDDGMRAALQKLRVVLLRKEYDRLVPAVDEVLASIKLAEIRSDQLLVVCDLALRVTVQIHPVS